MKAMYARATPEEAYHPRVAPGTGCVSLFFLFFFTIGGFFLSGATQGEYGNQAAMVVAAVVAVLWVVWVVTLIRRTRTRRAEQTGIDVLRTVLDFQLLEYYGVGVTAFFRPDVVAAGEETSFLIFAQNYTNRPRRLVLKLPGDRAFGFQKREVLRWELSPGQAVVYRRCIQVPADVPPGSYDGAMKVSVKLPRGQGARLIPKLSRRTELTATRIRTAAFGLKIEDVAARQSVNRMTECPPPEFLSLYTPALREPRFEVLQALTNGS